MMESPMRDWEAEDDANTLVRAEEIRKDSLRFDKATKAATVLAERRAKEAATLSALSRGLTYPSMKGGK